MKAYEKITVIRLGDDYFTGVEFVSGESLACRSDDVEKAEFYFGEAGQRRAETECVCDAIRQSGSKPVLITWWAQVEFSWVGDVLPNEVGKNSKWPRSPLSDAWLVHGYAENGSLILSKFFESQSFALDYFQLDESWSGMVNKEIEKIQIRRN